MISGNTNSAMIRVISLKEDLCRRDLFASTSTSTNLAWDFFDAHRGSGSNLLSSVQEQLRISRRELTKGEIGCYSSHFNVWEDFLKTNFTMLFVFEDDVVVDWSYLEFLVSKNLPLQGWDYIRLFNKVPVKQRRIQSPFLSPYHHLVQNLTPPFGTQAYYLSRRGAEIFRTKFSTIRRPIDGELDRSWETGVPSLSIFPSPVLERFVPSTIGEKRFRREHVNLQFLRMKVSEVLRRSVYNTFVPKKAALFTRGNLDGD